MQEPVTEFEMISFAEIDFGDQIFNSIKLDYPDHDTWHQKAMKTAHLRCAFIVRDSINSYAGVIILKCGEGPDGPLPTGLKISTFKVRRDTQAKGIADLLLSQVFKMAVELHMDVIFIAVMPGHEDMSRYLELRGFRRSALKSEKGESIYVADISHPERIYSDINRLAYDLLADEYRYRSHAPGPSQESPEYLAGLLASRLPKPIGRVLELAALHM